MRIFTLFCWLYSTNNCPSAQGEEFQGDTGRKWHSLHPVSEEFSSWVHRLFWHKEASMQRLPNLNIWCVFLWGDTFQLVDETECRQESSRRKECWKSGEKEWKWFLVPLRVSFCWEVNFCHIKKSKPKSLFSLYPTPHSFSTQSPCPSSFIAVAADRHKTSQGFLADGSVLGLLTTIRKGQDDGLQGATDPVKEKSQVRLKKMNGPYSGERSGLNKNRN